jgi:hypothetical protein
LTWGYRNLLVLSRFADGSTPPILAADESSLPAEIPYQKGTFVLRMLEDEVGSDAFSGALRDFVKQARRTRPLNLDAFIATVERHAGRSLTWFFTQWLKQATGPILSADLRARPGPSGVLLSGIIRQEKSVYQLRVPVRIELDSMSVDTMLIVRDTATPFVLALPAAPERLLIDPDNRLFKWFDADQLPITFADAWSSAAQGTVRIEYDPSATPDSVASTFRSFLRDRFTTAIEASPAERPLVGRVLLGEMAMRFRKSFVRWLPEPPGGRELRAFISRDPEDAARFVIGIEGAWPAKWPEVIPQVPWQEIRYVDGRMAGASAPSLPRIEIRFGH